MVMDDARRAAHLRALAHAVRPGDTVIEIGTGFGYFAVAAVRAGASRVFAIDTNEAVQIGARVAAENSAADRITFVQQSSEQFRPPAPADVVFCDLRGTMPFLGRHIPSVVDARTRLLKPGGRLVPVRDHLFVALAELPAGLREQRAATASPLDGITLGAVRSTLAQSLIRAWESAPSDLLGPGVGWGTIDYGTVTDGSADVTVRCMATRTGLCEGLMIWFDAELADGVGFSTAPGTALHSYGPAWLGVATPFAIAAGDMLDVRLRATLAGDDYVWTWELRGVAAGAQVAAVQSTLAAVPLSPGELRRSSLDFQPARSVRAELELRTLQLMDGSRRVEEIAEMLRAEFPGEFAQAADAHRHASTWSRERGT